jgi:putative ABC transport system permease protein
MNLVALKMLMGDKLKYFSLIAGLAFAAFLIVQQASIFTGFSMQMGAWVRDTSVADLWVMDDQMNFADDFKPILEDRLQRVRGIDGVEWAVPMFKSYLPVQLSDGTTVQCRVVGLDDATLMGGPARMVEGKLLDLRQDRGIFINVDQAGTSLRAVRSDNSIVVGTYKATKEFFWEPVLYTTYSRALNWAPRERKLLTYVLVKAKSGRDISSLKAMIKRTTGLAAYTNAELDHKTTSDLLGRTGILINFGITIALGFLIGVLISGQTFYMFILDNLKFFGALKAMGTSNGTIVRMVFLQTIVAGLIGYGIGLGGACISGMLFSRIGLAFQMPWQVPASSGVAIVFCCLVAAMLSLLRVLRLESAVVFKS